MAAPGEWTVSLTVSTPYSTVPGGVVFNALSAGIRNGATDGYDNAYDTVSLLESDDPVQAYFPHGATLKDINGDGVLDGWGCPNPDTGYNVYQCSLWRDFRALSEDKAWSIEVISPINGATISLNWRVAGDAETLSRVDLTLVDLSSSPPLPPIPLTQTSNHQYTNIFDAGKGYGLRRFEVRMKARGLFITTPSLPDATTGTLYNFRLSAVGGTPVWSIVYGELPPPFTLNLSTGEITGTPSAAGSYRFTVKVFDPVSGYSSSWEYTLVVKPSMVLRKGYNLISLPLIPVPNDRESLFGPVLGSPVALYRWYSAWSSAYQGITPPQYNLEDIMQPGMGYFLYSPADGMTVVIDGIEIEEYEYSVMLQGGWNMVGTPYKSTILLRDILLRNIDTGETISYLDAVRAGWIGNAIYQLKDGGYDFASFNDDPPAAFEPWVGYWIYVSNKDGVEVIFRRPD